MRLSAQHLPPGALGWDGAAWRHKPFTWAPDVHFPERFTTGHRVGDMPVQDPWYSAEKSRIGPIDPFARHSMDS